MPTLTWTKKIFSDNYHIYNGPKQIGYLKNPSFSQTSTGILNGKSYQFQTRGFFKQITQIIDLDNGQIIGQISYNSWMNKAEIVIENQNFHWSYANSWQNKWTITGQNGLLYFCQKKMNNGWIDIKGSEPIDIITLTSLFITNYYQQMSIAVMIAVFIPIYVSVLT